VPDHFLLRSQENNVFAAIQAAGLNPEEFEWTTDYSNFAHGDAAGMRVPVLQHKPSNAFFIFDWSVNRTPEQHVAFYTPGLDQPHDTRHAGNWESQLGYVRSWLEYLRREWEAPDLWAELASGRELGSVVSDAVTDNSPFNPQERAEISQKLEEVKRYVRQTYELNEAQYDAIDARLDYLVDAAARLGRVDWRNAFVGAFLGAVVQAVLPPEPVRDVVSLALRGLGHLFGVHIPELPR
jgi:hypothetical protein